MGDDPISGQLQAYDFKAIYYAAADGLRQIINPCQIGQERSKLAKRRLLAALNTMHLIVIAARLQTASVFHYIYNEANF